MELPDLVPVPLVVSGILGVGPEPVVDAVVPAPAGAPTEVVLIPTIDLGMVVGDPDGVLPTTPVTRECDPNGRLPSSRAVRAPVPITGGDPTPWAHHLPWGWYLDVADVEFVL